MREVLSGYMAANDREQMGRFLRHAFQLDVGSFPEARLAPQGEASLLGRDKKTK
jgi:hypothetical protein